MIVAIQPGGPTLGATSTTASSAAVAIPPLSNGANPKWVYVSAMSEGAAMGFIFGSSAVVDATTTNTLRIVSYAGGLIINVAGNTHYKHISTAAGKVYTMTPLAGINPGG